jgi:phosphocarrier protein HPr
VSAEAPGQPSQEEQAASAATARQVAKICNQRGLHARAAALFVKTAHRFDADIWVRKNGTIVSGRSIMGLMMLAAGAGAELEISAAGREADDAVRTLAHLVECKFDED